MKINIKGPIISSDSQWIYDWFGIEAVSPKMVIEQIDRAGNEDLEVSINSGGGSVFDASEIYEALKSHPGNVKGKIVGIAASAASVIAMACDSLSMAPTGQMMIHNASMIGSGDYRDMQHNADFLKNVNQTIANAYQIKSGKAYEELLSMMDQETWLTPQQALDHKLIDEIMFEQTSQAVASVGQEMMIPEAVIEKMRKELANGQKVGPTNTYQGTPPPEPNAHQKEDTVMNLEEIKNNHPELFKEIKNSGYDEGVTAENQRIQAIDTLRKPQDLTNEDFATIINKAKFETKASAGDTAVEVLNKAVQNDQTTKQDFLTNRVADAAPLNDVPGGDAPPPSSSNDQGDVDNIVSGFQGGEMK